MVSEGPLQREDKLTREVRHELVMRPYYEAFDAEAAVKRIEGVERAVNQMGHTALKGYAMQAVPLIHVVVNGNVELVGAMANEGDRTNAGVQANSVQGVFAVKNNLAVERR